MGSRDDGWLGGGVLYNSVTLDEDASISLRVVLEGEGKIRAAAGRLRLQAPKHRQLAPTGRSQTIETAPARSHRLHPEFSSSGSGQNRQPF
jgi:hypothetical protein